MTSVHRITTIPQRERAASRSAPTRLVGWVNVALAAAALVALLVYVVEANAIASGTWQLRDIEGQLSVVRTDHDALVAQRASLDDREVLLQLAEQSGMVPATAVRYVFEKGPVAAR
jgi:hypothetical protein